MILLRLAATPSQRSSTKDPGKDTTSGRLRSYSTIQLTLHFTLEPERFAFLWWNLMKFPIRLFSSSPRRTIHVPPERGRKTFGFDRR